MRLSTMLFSVLLSCAAVSEAFAANPYPGSILVLEKFSYWGDRGRLFAVNQANGNRTVISDFGNPEQGVLGQSLTGMARIPAGLLGGNDRWLIVGADGGTDDRGALYEVDLTNGARTLASDLGNPQQGPRGFDPTDVLCISPRLLAPISGTFVVDRFGGTDRFGAVFKVWAEGRRTLVADFGDNRGPKGWPTSLAWRPGPLGLGGHLLVTDSSAGTNQRGALFAIDPINKARTILSDFGDPSQGWIDPRIGIDADRPNFVLTGSNGSIFVLLSPENTTTPRGALVQVDPSSGYRSLISDFGDDSQGPHGYVPFAMSWSANQQWLYVIDALGTHGYGRLLQVDPATGSRLVANDFSDISQGELVGYPIAIEVN